MLRAALLAVCIVPWAMNTNAAEGQTPRNPTPVTDARICEVAIKPDLFNHKRIRLSGVVTQEFESFTIADPACSDAPNAAGIWLTFGGRVSAGVAYCCPGEGDRKRRPRDVMVEGLTVPLVENATLTRFVRLLRKNEVFAGRATLVGTFFAGHASEQPPTMRGYGHFGCCTLFVIEQVEQIAPLSAGSK